MYHDATAPGGEAEYWENAWSSEAMPQDLRFCSTDPLGPLLERVVHPGSVFLEGGCGRGSYVIHQAQRGARAVGFDFALRTLVGAKRGDPGLVLGAADVAHLPLRSRTVDTYYSGGVVEHFEEGPVAAIAEARRVLSPDGTLLISVPYFSPLRRTLARRPPSGWRITSCHGREEPPADLRFFQYVYTPAEFSKILQACGFTVMRRQAYSILWGLYELPLIGRRLSALSSTAEAAEPEHPSTGGNGGANKWRKLLKRLVVAEDVAVPILGVLPRVMRYMTANMMMYECKPSGPRQ